MKKVLLLTLLSAASLFTQSLVAQTTVYRETERLTSYWDANANKWQEQFITQSTYNSNGQITQDISKRYESSPNTWENTQKDDYIYYPSARTYVFYTWDPNSKSWTKTGRDSLIYPSGGLPEYEYYLSWDQNSNSWKYSSLYTRKYADGQVIDYLYQTYKNNSWVNRTHTTSTWSGGKLMETLTKSWDENTNSWQDKYSTKIIYSYNGSNGSMDSRISQFWDVNANGYVNSSRQSISGNVTTYQNWSNNAWVNTQRLTNTPNSQNQIASTVYEQWINNVWSKAAKDLFQYDANNNMTERIQQNYSNGWNNSYRYSYKYASYLGIVEGNPEVLAVNVFPNPASGMVNFHLGRENSGKRFSLQLFDLTGRCVYSSPFRQTSESLEISVGFLKNGIYTYKLSSENAIATGKVIIAH